MFDLEGVRNSIQKTFFDQEPLMLNLLTDNTVSIGESYSIRVSNEVF